MNKKCLLLVGAFPPDKCGIGDYSYQLVNSDSDKWECLVWKKWILKELPALIREINSFKIKNLNLQYPTKSSYASIVPHLVCIYYALFTSKIFTVTLHENSRMNIRYRLAANLFLLFADRVIFTTDFERQHALKKFPFRKFHYNVIKLFSNIDKVSIIKKTVDRKYDIAFFGLISSGKNIEKFISVVKKLRAQSCLLKTAIIGMVADEWKDYVEQLKLQALNCDIDFIFNLSNREVASILNNTKYIYLPFPDGVSERRGSFFAAILNGAIVLTTKGSCTTSEFASVCYYLGSEEDDVATINRLLNDENSKIVQEDLIAYTKKYMPESWKEVSEEYMSLFDE